ncbi:hypothetical protein AVEN_115792-1 [Araneus ventricosus]|uniref:Uncharacterized protein n=1 Tax=Araneus ventricosus TaxID=182803 RepID=A0A4Y2RQ37_ARAVE|nr:hypothetical protein AVEN_115792-1 [Araneus ventricosus]
MAAARGGTTPTICNQWIGCSIERVGEFLPRPSRYPNLIPRAFFFVKLHSIKPIIENWSEDVNRKRSTILTRLRIGHTIFTHRHLLLGEPAPTCPHCSCTMSVKHTR